MLSLTGYILLINICEYIRIGLTIARINAYNHLLFGHPKSGRKHEGSATFRLFSSDVEKVLNIADLKDHDRYIDEDGSDPAGNADLEPSPKRVRMERQEQEIVFLSVRAKITSPHASTSALIKSKEISPQERTRRIKTNGEQFIGNP
ncbi:Hypothetical predicted protein [Paramuricea clavata]|uniref:Uncharacterized protein n=1 Tax=Paramuricea clavata TaxID=317549 RepID=A0A6S7GET6_PARCT|nr:Hypothetical predicted protein [Paramuricea clavata]